MTTIESRCGALKPNGTRCWRPTTGGRRCKVHPDDAAELPRRQDERLRYLRDEATRLRKAIEKLERAIESVRAGQP